MIKFLKTYVSISLPVARALLTFNPSKAASEYRTTLGTGIESDALSATDAYTGLRFLLSEPPPEEHHGRVWGRSELEEAIRKATTAKLDTVKLYYKNFTRICTTDYVKFASLASIMQVGTTPVLTPNNPPEQSYTADGYGYDARYLARLQTVQRACQAKRATIVSLTGERDPLMFQVKGTEHTAHVAIMPRVSDKE